MRRAVLTLTLALSACAGGSIGTYGLIRSAEHAVGDRAMLVTSRVAWNRQSAVLFDNVRQVEDWTQHGPVLDTLSFISGLQDRKSIVRQSRRADQQVPLFRADMTAPEIAAMLETYFRTRAGTVEFRTLGLAPRGFLGANGFQHDFEHLDSDELWRRGRAVGAVVNGRLYLVLLDAARSHYFPSELAEFEAIVSSARLRR